MTARAFPTRAAGTTLSALLVVAALLVASNEGRPRLDPCLLTSSRGSNPNYANAWTDCITLNGYGGCTFGQPCKGCRFEVPLNFAGPGYPGGYNAGNPNGACGGIVTNGTCDINDPNNPGQWCSPVGNTPTPCKSTSTTKQSQ